MKPGNERERLMDPTAIAANREGRLSPEQAIELSRRARRSRLVRVAEALTCLGLAVLLVAVVVQSGRVIHLDIDSLAVPAAILLILGLTLVGLRPWSDVLGDDVRAGRVESTFGVPHRSERGTGLTGTVIALLHYPTFMFLPATHVVSIGEKQFLVPAATAAAVSDVRQAVRAYYLPRSMTLVSLSPT